MLLACASQASAASLEKQFKKYMALPPEHFEKSATVKDDDMEIVATITTEPGFKIKQGLIGLVNDDNFFRAFVNKKTGETSYQLYQYVTYVGDWAFFETVNYEGLTEIESTALTVIDREVGTCSQMIGCFKTETMAFDVAEEVLLTCPLLGGPKSMLFWTRKEKTNAIQETHAGGDYRQAA